MKKTSLLFAALLSGIAVFAAEMPDFTKAEAWKKSAWSPSVYTRSTEGVLTVERTQAGSGAWCTVPIAVTPGEKFTGAADIAYLTQDGRGCARLGANFVNAKGKRVKFDNLAGVYALNGGFENKKFSFTVPEGATAVSIYVCIDGKGKAEFRNLTLKK